MKRKVLSIVLAVAMLFSLLNIIAFAEEPVIASLSAERFMNGEVFWNGPYNPRLVKADENIELGIGNILANGQFISSQEATYIWYKDNVEIPGATAETYEFKYDGAQYSCLISYMGIGCFFEFFFKEDTLEVTVGSDAELVLSEDEMYTFVGGEVGDATDIWVNATSTAPNANITYVWERWEMYTLPGQMTEFEVLDNNTNRCQVVRREGTEGYTCTVDDGNCNKIIYFQVDPVDTMTDTTYIDGIAPESYAGMYIAVANPGETVTIKIPATSTKGNVTYKWYKTTMDDQTGMVYELLDNTSDTLSVEKTAPVEDNIYQVYGEQTYECYVEDGNERSRYWYMLFCLHPEQIESQSEIIGEDTPKVTLDDNTENLTNNIFREEMMEISAGETGEVKLTAELKGEVSSKEQEIINNSIDDNTKIGLNLDINLYKTIFNETTQVTETAKEVNISVAVPENLINTNTDFARTYQVVRLHNGEAEILDCEFDKDSKKLSFETDKFSTYTVIYTDKQVAGEGEAQKEPTNNQNKEDGKEDVKIPATGDTSNTALWLILLLTSAVTLSAVTIKIKD
ncbi:MAG: hypothetical protein IJP21_05465 [Clostridia bacterium]|nr:hypothetical protein [Clostridia bacterium]